MGKSAAHKAGFSAAQQRPWRTKRARQVHAHGFVNAIQTTLLKPLTTAGQKAALNEGIRGFYDSSSRLWETQWGEHMHHGYYKPGSTDKTSRVEAQVDMIEQVLQFANVTRADRMLDVGCGIGGSSRYIASKLNCSAHGITLSPVQAERANQLSRDADLSDRCAFTVADALHTPFDDGTFDLVWSLESGEHMPDKKKFVSELSRVASPGGRVIVVTWCHRDLRSGESSLRGDEQSVLERINEAYYLPKWCSLEDYKRLFEEAGFTDIKAADWSENIAPFWGEVWSQALTPQGVLGLLGAGWETVKGALVVPLMQKGYDMGVVKFVIITGTKAL